VVSPAAPTIAFDIGPANALIDAAVWHTSGGAEEYDRSGARARRGRVHAGLLERLLAEPYYRRPPPKSTGKELFHLDYLLDHVTAVGAVDADDLVTTVTELTAVTVAAACRDFDVRRLVVSGGGADNPVLMERLAAALAGVTLTTIDAYGIPSGSKEAYLFALLGFLTVHGLAGNVPSATGADRSVVLGCVIPGRTGFPAVEPPAVAPSRLVVLP
jgi:anhydro-N-acetylmuramic acid kinase